MTAMDDHFNEQAVEVPEGVDTPQEEGPAQAGASKTFDVKRIISGGVVVGLCGLVGYHFYTKYFPAQEGGDASFRVAEVDTTPAQHVPVALVSNAPASAASIAEQPSVVAAPAASSPLTPAPTEAPSAPKAPTPLPLQEAVTGDAQATIHPAGQGALPKPQAGVDQIAQARSAERQALADVSRLTGELKMANDKASTLQSEVSRLTDRIRALEASKAAGASAPAQRQQVAPSARQAQPKAAVAAALPKHPQAVKAQEPQAASSAAAPKTPSTVTAAPARFRIYAMRENMAWVQDIKSRETIPAPVGATLPDGSRVQRVDESEGVIYTTTGEVRYAGSGRN